MEHLRQLGLSRDPFSNDPVPDLYFASPGHRGAEQRLGRAIAQHRGLCVLSGEPGAGKSLLARRLLAGLEDEAYEASLLVLIHSGLDAVWLLSRLARGLGQESPAEGSLGALARIYDRLCALREEGRRAVLFVDNAHLLGAREHMEALRALVDLEYEDRHLLTLVLVGRTALDEALALDPALADRVEARVSLGPMDPATAASYLAQRIRDAGGPETLLEPEAAAAVARWGEGLPRPMNILADNALFEAHLAGRDRVDLDAVERAARSLGLESVAAGPLADSVHPPGPAPPGGEAIDLGDMDEWSEEALAILDAPEEDKEPEEAPLFAAEEPRGTRSATPHAAEEGVDRDVEDVFERLVDD